ncbi:MAG: methylmalonyl-CoA epimerase [bacterium]|nr:methylmalonyl-CoA epimerase [bacterium]
MIRRIDHIGIAVDELEKSLPFWAEALGLDVEDIETVPAEKVKVAFLPVGKARIELLEATDEDSTVARYVAKRGGGIHHLTFEVDDLGAALTRLHEHGAQILGEAPRIGAGGHRVAFVHPKSTGGVLLELVERRATTEALGLDIRPGVPILLYLRDPQEKLWGVLGRLDTAGVVLHGIDLSSFDDWVAQIERDEESVVGPSILFVPMGRVEKILLDRASGHLPSLADRFERRTGRRLNEVLAETERGAE